MALAQTLFRARLARRGDGPILAEGLSRWDPALAALGAGLGPTLSALIGEECLRGGCVEETLPPPETGWQVSATGASAFISNTTAQALLDNPSPFFAAQLMARIMAGERDVLLDPAAIARENAGDGLTLFVLGFTHRYGGQDHPNLRPLLGRAIDHFVYAHRGYKLRRMLREDPDPIADVLVTSGMTVAHHFGAVGRKLLVAEPSAQAPIFPHSVTSALFAYSPPQVHFAKAERRLLELAVDGLSDGEIAGELQISLNTVKQTWRSVYERAVRRVPLVLGEGADLPAGGVRGQEKRRHLIAYLRDHPQELRPQA